MNAHFEITDTPLEGLRLLTRKPIGDDRGFLERLFCVEDLKSLVSYRHIAQINRTLTEKRGTVRGMHYQRPPHAETKFVSCLKGEIFDVAVDLRCGSTTFLKWHGERLTASGHKTLVIPEGFAHGFQSLTDNCEILYFHTACYNADAEDGCSPTDAILAIDWPLEVCDISIRDASHPALRREFKGVDL